MVFFHGDESHGRIRKKTHLKQTKELGCVLETNLKIRCQQESEELPTSTGLLFRIQQNEATKSRGFKTRKAL